MQAIDQSVCKVVYPLLKHVSAAQPDFHCKKHSLAILLRHLLSSQSQNAAHRFSAKLTDLFSAGIILFAGNGFEAPDLPSLSRQEMYILPKKEREIERMKANSD